MSSTTTSTTATQGGGQVQKRFIGPTIEAAKLGLATAAEGKLNTGQPVNAQEWAASEHALTAAASGQQAAASGTTSPASTSSRTTWIIVGSALAALIVVVAAWAVMRRRRRPGELAPATSNGSASEAFCAQHPDDALCRSA